MVSALNDQAALIFLSYLHGEQIIPILLGFLVVTAALIVLCSWLLFRYFNPRIGRKAYAIGAVPLLLVSGLAFVEFRSAQPYEGPPKVVAAEKISGMMKGLPAYADFSLSGISFFDGQLYVATNLGMIEVSGGKPSRLYKFQPSDSVVSGPWLDRSDHLLWAMDDHSGELLSFDGKNWKRIKEPTPSKGYYSRGDVLEGIRPIGNPEGFWLAAGGSAWRWDPSGNRWDEISVVLGEPNDNGPVNEIIGVLPVGKQVLLIVRRQMLAFLVKEGEDFNSDELVASADSQSSQIKREGKPFLADSWAVTEDAGYICSKDQRLFATRGDSVHLLDAPGPCEDVSTDDQWNLIVSVKAKGIYRYAGGEWTLLADSPYPNGEGEYWTHLSESSGQLALALDAKPVVDQQHSNGRDMHFIRNAPTALWVAANGKFNRITF